MIYTITTIKRLDVYNLGRRTVGYYKEFSVAEKAVKENWLDIYEDGHYPYCVIEAVEQGIYVGCGYGEHWYKWKDDGYKPMDKPKEFKHTIAFSMG